MLRLGSQRVAPESLFLFGGSIFVDKINDAHVRDASVSLESYLAGMTVRIPHLNVVGLNLGA